MRHLWILLATISCMSLYAEPSRVMESQPISSKSLKKTTHFSIYLPAGYDSSVRSYPVLYLLHGYGDNNTGWIHKGNMQKIADRSAAQGLSTDMIIVMPEGEKSWYRNWHDGSIMMEDFIIKELIPYIEKNYRCVSERNSRAIAGLSMGGYGAMLYALKYPELFAASCPLSGALFDADGIKQWLESRQMVQFTPAIYDYYQANYSIIKLLADYQSKREQNKKELTVRFYVDCGDDDFLWRENLAVYSYMKQADLPLEYRMHDGAHTWSYWRTALPEVLAFVTKSFVPGLF